MSMRVGVEIGVPGVINGAADAPALAVAVKERLPMAVTKRGTFRVHDDRICCGLEGRTLWGGRGIKERDALSEDRSIVGWTCDCVMAGWLPD